MFYELSSKDRIKIIKNVKSYNMITEDTQAQIVIIYHYTEF